MKRRGQCPTLEAPILTGDGLVARVPAPHATIGLDALTELCAAAQRHGNGTIEITARGNLQIRGLTEASHTAFAATLAAALCLNSCCRVPIAANPLAGWEPEPNLDVRPLVDELCCALAAKRFDPTLAPKVSVVIDGSGLLHLDALAADVRLRASPTVLGPNLYLAVEADRLSPHYLGAVPVQAASKAVAELLAVIARRGATARARDIVRTEGLSVFREALTGLLTRVAAPAPRPPAEPLGVHALKNGTVALGLALPFGQVDQRLLAELIGKARRAKAAGVRPAAPRALLIMGLAPAVARRLQSAAQRLGFIVSPADPRRQIIACVGAPSCAFAAIATRALGRLIAQSAGTLFDGSFKLHLSGCAKGCAYPGGALTIVGRGGSAGVVPLGRAHDPEAIRLSPDLLPTAFANLARELEHARRPGERSADVLARLGPQRVLMALRNGRADG